MLVSYNERVSRSVLHLEKNDCSRCKDQTPHESDPLHPERSAWSCSYCWFVFWKGEMTPTGEVVSGFSKHCESVCVSTSQAQMEGSI